MVAEVPDLPQEKAKKLAAKAWVSGLYAATGFIMEKLGPAAVEEYCKYSARMAANALRASGVKDALGFALANAILFKNAYGSHVEVSGGPGSAELKLIKCSNLEAALELAEQGLPVSREGHCAGCIRYMKALASELGLGLEAELSEHGCSMRIYRK